MGARRKRSAGSRSTRFESLESRRVLAGGEINLGPQTDIFDQPYVQIELRDGPTIIGPTGGDEFGIYPYNRLLLDTGANGIIAVNDVVRDMEQNGFVSEGEFEESGVSGTSYFDVSAAYEFRYWGTGENPVVHTLSQTADDVRIMTNPTMNFGAPASEGGIPGIAGMPLMAGRVTTLDMGPWNEVTDLFELPPLGVTFDDELPADGGHRYSVIADTRTVFDPRDGLPEGSPPDAPLPSWAPITFFDVTTKFQGTSVTGGLLLDTGAQLSMISSQMAYDLGLDENGDGSFLDEAVDVLPIIGVGGTIDIPLLLIDELSIPTEQGTFITFGGGDGEDDYIVVAVHDVAPGIDGIFGADLLTSGLGINYETFEVIGKPYFTQIHMDFRELVTQGEGRLYFDVNALYDVEVPVNAAPVLSIDGGAIYTENESAALIVSAASVTDSDSVNFDSGAVTAAITVNVTPTDRLELVAGNGFTLSGDDVSYNGTLIGTVSGGEGIAPLVVDLNDAATPENAAALIQQIGYRSTSDQPSTQTRTIEFRITDGDGGQSNTPTESVTVAPVNDAPVLDTSLNPTLATIAEDAISPASTLVSALLTGAVSDPDAGGLRGIAVTAASSSVGTWQFSLNGGATWQAMGTPSESAAKLLPGSARIRLLPKANFNGTVKLYYRAWDQFEGSSGGTFNLVGHTDDPYAFSVAKESAALTVTPVNDSPTLGLSGSLSYIHDKAAVLLAPFAAVTDVDSVDFGGGRLRVRIDLASSSNRLVISGGFTVDANNNVLLSGVIIGKRASSGFGTKELVVTFNKNATRSIVQQLVRAIAFKTVGGTAGTRSVFFSVADGDGGLSPEASKTVNVL